MDTALFMILNTAFSLNINVDFSSLEKKASVPPFSPAFSHSDAPQRPSRLPGPVEVGGGTPLYTAPRPPSPVP